MSEDNRQTEILTREELDALLASLAEDRSDREGGRGARPFQTPAATTQASDAPPALRRALETFAREQTRHLSNVYQSKIEYRLLSIQSMTHGDFAETLLDTDRIATFKTEPSGATGFVWLSRSLVFSLLSLILGARPTTRGVFPKRPYSGVEHRIYRRSVADILAQLDRCWGDLLQTRSTDISIQPPAVLGDDPGKKILLVNLDIQGLSAICRARIGLPESAFADLREATAGAAPATGAVERVVEEMPLELRVELGSVEMSLSELTALHAGSVIPFDSHDDGTLLVRVEGQPKFRAIRGSVGHSMAVQLTERLERVVEVHDGT